MCLNLILVLLLITVLSCDITFHNKTIDYEATDRTEIKQTLQVIKNQTESTQSTASDSAQENVGSKDATEKYLTEEEGEEQPEVQNTQSPAESEATIDPSKLADIVLGDSEIVIIPSYTPTDIPFPDILPPDPQGFPLHATDTLTPSVTLISFKAYKCGRHTTVQFHINNNSDVMLELADVACFHKGSGDVSSASTSTPFHQSANECPPGLDRLGPGVNSNVVLQPNWPYHMHSGEKYYCNLGLWETDTRSGKSYSIYGPEFTAP